MRRRQGSRELTSRPRLKVRGNHVGLHPQLHHQMALRIGTRGVSSGHWATIELGADTKDKKDDKDKDTSEGQTSIREPMITVRSSGSLK
jgi:hypothetical protein